MEVKCRVAKSTIRGAGKGLFAAEDIRKGTRIGQYCGKRTRTYPRNADYAFAIDNGRKTEHYIDARKSRCLLKYVNGARTRKQHRRVNLEAYQYKKNIYYRSTRNIKKGEELILDYGDDYWV